MTVPHNPDIRWRKARQSQDQGACIELAHTGTAVRDSKNPDGPWLTVNVADVVAVALAFGGPTA